MIFRRRSRSTDPIVRAVRRWTEVRPVVSVKVLRPLEPVSSAETAGRTDKEISMDPQHRIQESFLDYVQQLSLVGNPSASELQMWRMIWFCSASSMLATFTEAAAAGREVEVIRATQDELKAFMLEAQADASHKGR